MTLAHGLGFGLLPQLFGRPPSLINPPSLFVQSGTVSVTHAIDEHRSTGLLLTLGLERMSERSICSTGIEITQLGTPWPCQAQAS